MRMATDDERSRVGASARGRRSLRERLHRLDAKASPYLYIAPFFLLFAVFGLFPLVYTAWVSLTDRNLLDPDDALRRARTTTPTLLHDSYFWNAVENTLGDLRALDRAAAPARARRSRTCSTRSCAARTLLPDERAAAAGHLARRRRADLHAALRARLRPGQLRARRGRHRHGRLGGRDALVLDRALGDGHLAVDRLQRADLPGRDAGDPGRALRGGGDRRRAAAGGSSGTSRSRCSGRRSSSPSSSPRSAASSSSPSRTCSSRSSTARTGGSGRQYQTVAMYLYEKAFGGTQFKFGYAVGDRAGRCSCSSRVISLVNFLIVRRIRSAD